MWRKPEQWLWSDSDSTVSQLKRKKFFLNWFFIILVIGLDTQQSPAFTLWLLPFLFTNTECELCWAN